jgi:hypothetical protein
MRQMISGLVAAFAVFVAGAAPAKACDGGCSPCAYVNPCGAAYERLPDPEVQYHSAPRALPQYYYVNQGPTYTGPGDFAPRRVYREGGVYGWGVHHHWRHHYGYEGRWYPHRHFYHWHHYATPYRYGYHYRPHVLHSYY